MAERCEGSQERRGDERHRQGGDETVAKSETAAGGEEQEGGSGLGCAEQGVEGLGQQRARQAVKGLCEPNHHAAGLAEVGGADRDGHTVEVARAVAPQEPEQAELPEAGAEPEGGAQVEPTVPHGGECCTDIDDVPRPAEAGIVDKAGEWQPVSQIARKY
eukprot:scaffold12145_cov101-Isochrysis_galbana.AAC.1